jgi:demethylmenaquinone methyltransferase/2-methoxy-6-polyprenyl-1,4-benzoquinol methylase
MSEEVREMFSNISKDYDKMNDVLSFKMHIGWKKKLISLSKVGKGSAVLDCASGTGDLAILFKQEVGERGEVYATDFCNDMLKYTKPKAEKLDLDVNVEIADAMNLQFDNDKFDVTSISYGIRNVDDTPTALKEMARVTKKGGCLAVLETGQPPTFMKPFYSVVTKVFMPFMGMILAKDKSAYKYLAETASKYPYGKEFCKIVMDTGAYKSCKAYPQFFGASYIYIAEVK